MSILKLYQGFHNEESYKEAALTSSSSVIKISLNPHPSFTGNFSIAKDIKYTTNQIAEFRALQYAYNHIEQEQYIGYTVYQHNKKFSIPYFENYHYIWNQNYKGTIRIEKITPGVVIEKFKQCHIIALYPYCKNFITQTEKAHPDMIEFLFNWLNKKNYKFNEQKIREIAQSQTAIFALAFILPVKEFKELHDFIMIFIDDLKDPNKYNLNIKIHDPIRAWAYFIERLICIWPILKWGEDLKIGLLEKEK